ncbi:MAG: HEAT repeat domain-containing protein, partial [Thermoanaerobaculia bacterium]
MENPGADPIEARQEAGLHEVAVLLQLVDRQHYEPWLVGKMVGGEPRIREALAIALGRIGDPRGRAELERLVVDGEPRVRRAAAFALGLLEDWGAAPMLLWVAADPDPETGVLAVEALARIGVPLERVQQALQEVEDAAERRRRLLPALFRFQEEARVAVAREVWRCASSPPSAGTTAGGECAGTRDPEVRRWAAYALAREPLPEARPDLLTLLADADTVIRAWGAKALGRVGTGEDLTALRGLLRDPEPGPVIEALRAGAELVERGDAAPPADWRDELLRLLDDPRPGVRVTAIEAAGVWLLDQALGAALA